MTRSRLVLPITPSGRPISDNGIDPDYEVTSRDAQKADVDQLNKAREVLSTLVDAGGPG